MITSFYISYKKNKEKIHWQIVYLAIAIYGRTFYMREKVKLKWWKFIVSWHLITSNNSHKCKIIQSNVCTKNTHLSHNFSRLLFSFLLSFFNISMNMRYYFSWISQFWFPWSNIYWMLFVAQIKSRTPAFHFICMETFFSTKIK